MVEAILYQTGYRLVEPLNFALFSGVMISAGTMIAIPFAKKMIKNEEIVMKARREKIERMTR